MTSPSFNLIKKWIPYLSGIIIVGGILYLIIFYLAFGIEITQYMDLSDCLLLQLDKFIYFILFVGICYFIGRLEYHDIVSDNTAPVSDNDTYTRSPNLKVFNKRFAGMYCLLLTLYCTYSFEKSTSKIIVYTSIIFGSVLFILILWVFKKHYFQNLSANEKTTGFSDSLIIRLALLYFLYMSSLGFSNAKQINGGYSKSTEEFKITLRSNEVLNNSDTLAFVGKLRNYYFLHNPKSKSKIIIPSGEILRCDMTSIFHPDLSDTCVCFCLP